MQLHAVTKLHLGGDARLPRLADALERYAAIIAQRGVAFFILTAQVFVGTIEFKLISLAGFILAPFAIWNRNSFLAESVLGNVGSSGIKVMVLAVIVGISSNIFAEFTAALQGQEPCPPYPLRSTRSSSKVRKSRRLSATISTVIIASSGR